MCRRIYDRTGRYISMTGVTDLSAVSWIAEHCIGIYGKGGLHMINFEEELAKFKLSKEVDEVEQILRNQTVSDIADLLAEVMEEKRKN